MSLCDALRELSVIVRKLEDEGYVVRDASVPDGTLVTEEAISMNLHVEMPLSESIVTDNCVQIDVCGNDRVESTGIPADLSVRIPLREASEMARKVDRRRIDAVPAYKDPEALRDAYDTCETFEEMTTLLDVDVSPSTVRRHMIKHGIHVPESMISSETPADRPATTATPPSATVGAAEQSGNVTESESDSGTQRAETPTSEPLRDSDAQVSVDSSEPANGNLERGKALTDGLGLPEHLSLDDLVEIVTASSTIFEVSRKMNVERERAHEILRGLDLLDLVTGRLSTAVEREVSTEEVVDRIQTAVGA